MSEPLRWRLSCGGRHSVLPAYIALGLWEKLLLALAIGGVGATTGISVDHLREESESRSLLSAAMREIPYLAVARVVRLPEHCFAIALDFVACFPPEATGSHLTGPAGSARIGVCSIGRSGRANGTRVGLQQLRARPDHGSTDLERHSLGRGR
jgi:hypothetical protein